MYLKINLVGGGYKTHSNYYIILEIILTLIISPIDWTTCELNYVGKLQQGDVVSKALWIPGWMDHYVGDVDNTTTILVPVIQRMSTKNRLENNNFNLLTIDKPLLYYIYRFFLLLMYSGHANRRL